MKFTHGHAMYLEHEIEKFHKRLAQLRPEPAVAKTMSECGTQVEMLQHELVGIAANAQDRNQLLASRARILNIRKTLKGVSTTL